MRTVLIDDAARILGCSRRTVYARIAAGVFRTVRTRSVSQRVVLADLDAWIARRRGADHLTRRRRAAGEERYESRR